MRIYRMTTPLDDAMVKQLKAGDLVTLSGHIYGIRDATLIRMFDDKVDIPVDLSGAVCLHTAPGVRQHGNQFVKVSIGTTTSTRMNRFTAGLMGKGVKAIAGKGGLLDDSTRLLQEYGGVYFGLVGGTAASETMQIEAIEEVWWRDLMPECLWKFRVRDFGPLIVGIDAYGRNLYLETMSQSLDAARNFRW